MTTVLVTGGTGALGTELVPRLVAAGHDVSVLSRKDRPALPSGVTAVRGDLATGDGLAAATEGADVIAHLASGTGGLPSYKKAKRTDVDGTGRLLAAAQQSGHPHVVYISIVGVDEIPLGYYRAKLETERLIEASGLPFTILRTTQWHTLAFEFCRQIERAPLVPVPKGFRSQLLDVGEVADRMAGLVGGAPSGRVADMGGPEALAMSEIVRRYLAAKSKRRLVVSVPIPSRTWRAFAAGHNLAEDHIGGRITWDEYLSRAI
jgi:uncharacterized protein YbjT (DUF2867 family)